MACVYVFRNKINKRCYVGQTIQDFNKRFNRHLSNTNIGSKLPLHNALRKYGIENFDIKVIELPNDKDILDHFEKALIKDLKDFNNHEVYNLTDGGEGGSHCEVTRKLLSEIHKGKHYSPNTEWSKGSKHPRSKSFILIHPDGTEEKFCCIRDACRKYILDPSYIVKTLRGKKISCKGFKARYIDE